MDAETVKGSISVMVNLCPQDMIFLDQSMDVERMENSLGTMELEINHVGTSGRKLE